MCGVRAMACVKLPSRGWLRLEEAIGYWQANTPAVANAVPQRQELHVKAGEVTYLLPPPAREFADTPESDPDIIAMRKVAAAEKGRDLKVDVLQPDPRAAAAMREFDCKLSEAAFAKRVQFRGKRDTVDELDHEPIPFGYFSTERGFCLGSEIEPFPYPINDETLFKAATSGKVAIWHDVLVHRDEFMSWLAEAYPSCANLVRDSADLSRSRPAADTEDAALGGRGNRKVTGKWPVVVEWLKARFAGKPVPEPALAPRKALIAEAIKALSVLGGKLDDDTMKRAIEAYNANVTAGQSDPK